MSRHTGWGGVGKGGYSALPDSAAHIFLVMAIPVFPFLSLLLLCNNRISSLFSNLRTLVVKRTMLPLHTDVCHRQKAQLQESPRPALWRPQGLPHIFEFPHFQRRISQTLKSNTIFWTISVTKWAFERWYMISSLIIYLILIPIHIKTKQDGGRDELIWKSLKSQCCVKDGSCYNREQKLALSSFFPFPSPTSWQKDVCNPKQAGD